MLTVTGNYLLTFENKLTLIVKLGITRISFLLLMTELLELGTVPIESLYTLEDPFFFPIFEGTLFYLTL